jgi:hypothetical protein
MDFNDDCNKHIALYNGQQGRRLAYVIRESATVKLEADKKFCAEKHMTFVSLGDKITAQASLSGIKLSINNLEV